jgi:hypothetical protein
MTAAMAQKSPPSDRARTRRGSGSRATRTRNIVTKQPIKRRRSTGVYLGVATQTGGVSWQAYICVQYRNIHIASFARQRDAAVARDRVALRLLGKDAVLNFPRAKLEPASVEEMRRWARQLRKRRAADTSSFLGVSCRPDRPGYPWLASLSVRSRTLRLGHWRSEREAAEAHDKAVLHYFGVLRNRLNFPDRARALAPADMASLRQEAMRRHKATTSSRYIGVTWMRSRNCWSATLLADGQRHNIGYFHDEEEAAWKRDTLAIKLLGKRACLNFHPESGEEVYGRQLGKLVARKRRE